MENIGTELKRCRYMHEHRYPTRSRAKAVWIKNKWVIVSLFENLNKQKLKQFCSLCATPNYEKSENHCIEKEFLNISLQNENINEINLKKISESAHASIDLPNDTGINNSDFISCSGSQSQIASQSTSGNDTGVNFSATSSSLASTSTTSSDAKVVELINVDSVSSVSLSQSTNETDYVSCLEVSSQSEFEVPKTPYYIDSFDSTNDLAVSNTKFVSFIDEANYDKLFGSFSSDDPDNEDKFNLTMDDSDVFVVDAGYEERQASVSNTSFDELAISNSPSRSSSLMCSTPKSKREFGIFNDENKENSHIFTRKRLSKSVYEGEHKRRRILGEISNCNKVALQNHGSIKDKENMHTIHESETKTFELDIELRPSLAKKDSFDLTKHVSLAAYMTSQLISGQFNFNKFNKIGSGYTSKVYSCEMVNRRNLVACKIMPKQQVTKDQAVHEIEILVKAQSPFVANFIHAYELFDSYVIVSEYCQKGSLYSQLQKLDKKEVLARQYMRDVIYGLNFLHRRGISHGDIKMKNIVITTLHVAKLTDFGFSMIHSAEDPWKSRRVGTKSYWSPEMMRPGRFNAYLADVWALGVTFVGVVKGRPIQLKHDIHGIVEEMMDDHKRDLFQGLLQREPKRRLKFCDMLKNQWLVANVEP